MVVHGVGWTARDRLPASSASSPRRRGATSRSATCPVGALARSRSAVFSVRFERGGSPRGSHLAPRSLPASSGHPSTKSMSRQFRGVVGVKSGMHGDAPAPGRGGVDSSSVLHPNVCQRPRILLYFHYYLFYSSLLNQLLSACFDLTLTANPRVYRRTRRLVGKRFPAITFRTSKLVKKVINRAWWPNRSGFLFTRKSAAFPYYFRQFTKSIGFTYP